MSDKSKHTRLNKVKWDKWAETFDDDNWKNNYLRKAQSNLISLLNLKENMRFLDVGCGTGWALGEISRRLDDKGEFCGIDMSDRMIEKTAGNYGGRNNFRFITANAESIPIRNDLFDTVICTNSFHHYLNPLKALKEIRRLLKSGGTVYILDLSADYLIIKVLDKASKTFDRSHVKLYSTREFKKLFENAELIYSETKTIFSYQKIQIGKK